MVPSLLEIVKIKHILQKCIDEILVSIEYLEYIFVIDADILEHYVDTHRCLSVNSHSNITATTADSLYCPCFITIQFIWYYICEEINHFYHHYRTDY